jgi:hypothetical protein
MSNNQSGDEVAQLHKRWQPRQARVLEASQSTQRTMITERAFEPNHMYLNYPSVLRILY